MISPAGPADRERVLDSLVAAFAADPVLRYLFPDDGTYPRHAIGGAWLRRQIVADWLARREAS